MITLKQLKDDYFKQNIDDFEIIDNCEEHLIVAPKSYEGYLWFAEDTKWVTGKSVKRYLNRPKYVIIVTYNQKYLHILGTKIFHDEVNLNHSKYLEEARNKIYDYYFGTEEKQLVLAKIDPWLVVNSLSKDPSEVVQLELIRNNPNVMNNIRSPYESVEKLYRKLCSYGSSYGLGLDS